MASCWIRGLFGVAFFIEKLRGGYFKFHVKLCMTRMTHLRQIMPFLQHTFFSREKGANFIPRLQGKV